MMSPCKLFLYTITLMWAIPLVATTPTKQITIISDTLEINRHQNISIFSGNVQATQDDLVVLSDVMTVYHQDATSLAGSEIDKIAFNGHVDVKRGERHAIGDTGLYLVTKELLTLDHHVTLTEAEHTVMGEHLVYDLKTDKAVLTGDTAAVPAADNATTAPKGRVKAILTPE
jgi:lipopolysaccharide transport protein LptA